MRRVVVNFIRYVEREEALTEYSIKAKHWILLFGPLSDTISLRSRTM